MSVFEPFHFLRPGWLLLVPLAIWMWWRLGRLQDSLRGWRAVMDVELLEAMRVGGNDRITLSRYGLLVVWLLGAVAIAGPTWRPEPSPFADDPVPVIVLLAATETMDLSDLSPSRMERARLKITDLAEERKGQPMGLIAYAGSSHLVLPPTRDTSVVASMAREISPQIMPKTGSDLFGALTLAAKTLGDAGGSIVVVADTVQSGQDEQLQIFHNENRVPVFFLAVARSETPELDAIESAAASLGGHVTLMTADTADIQAMVKRVASTPVAVSSTDSGTRWAEAGWYLVPVLALLVAASFRRVENSNSSSIASPVEKSAS